MVQVIRHRLAVVLVTGSLLLVGCSDGGLARVYPVEGTVKGGSSSLEGVTISFIPVEKEGSGATGVIGADGSFKLTALDGRPGCPAGKYKVVLSLGQEAMQKAMMDLMTSGAKPGSQPRPGGAKGITEAPKFTAPFPDTYRDALKSPKTVEVEAKPNKLEIAIEAATAK